MDKEEFLKYAAHFSLGLLTIRVLWPDFTGTVRMIWGDVVAAVQAVSGLKMSWSVLSPMVLSVALTLVAVIARRKV
jgi:hypothetical protein